MIDLMSKNPNPRITQEFIVNHMSRNCPKSALRQYNGIFAQKMSHLQKNDMKYIHSYHNASIMTQDANYSSDDNDDEYCNAYWLRFRPPEKNPPGWEIEKKTAFWYEVFYATWTKPDETTVTVTIDDDGIRGDTKACEEFRRVFKDCIEIFSDV